MHPNTVCRKNPALIHDDAPCHCIDEKYCPGCGRYNPCTLGGDRTTCGCAKTPPAGNLPPNIYLCPTCGGYGDCRYGCWGTKENPHEHCFMKEIHELISFPLAVR